MKDSGFVSHCLELFTPLGRTSSRRMFGGHALYIDGLCMALIIREVLYLKVDDTHRAVFEHAGGQPFTYTAKNEDVHSLSYYTVPEEAMESPAEMAPWARRGLAAAVAARAKAPPAKKKSSSQKAVVKGVAAKPATARKPAAKKNVAARKVAKP